MMANLELGLVQEKSSSWSRGEALGDERWTGIPDSGCRKRAPEPFQHEKNEFVRPDGRGDLGLQSQNFVIFF